MTSREEVLRVLRDPGRYTVDHPDFATARIVGPSMLSTEGAEHDAHRAPYAPVFKSERVRALEGFVREQAHALADGFADPVELRTAYAGPLATRVMIRVLELDLEEADVLAAYRDVVKATVGDIAEADGRAAFGRLGLDGDQGVILFGGIETTEGMICNLVWHLLSHPDALARVRASPQDQVPRAVEESLRLEPAAAVVDRYDRDEHVVVSLREANRDPATFDEPEAFRLDRANARSHLTFAAGPHVCLGLHLARLEARVALEVLLERFAHLELAEPTEPEGDVFRKPPALTVRITGT